MSNASNLSTLANVLDDGSDGQFLKSTGSGGVAFDTVAAGAVVYATADLLPLSGNSAGDMAYVTATNRFYINNGSGWYSVSLVNTNPSITSVQDASSNTTPFTLATDGTATVITVTAADPEEVPLTYGYSVTTGDASLNGSTVAQGTGSNSNVFTVTPHASQDATFTITFTASDGINQATSANAFSLSFVTTVADSNHTTLLATATGTSDNNNITDSSSNSHSITVNGDAHAGTFSPYRSGGYSTYFDGSGDYLEISDDSSLQLGTGDFTIEAWVYPTSWSNSTLMTILSKRNSSSTGYWRLGVTGGNGTVSFQTGSSGTHFTLSSPSSDRISLNEWSHLAVTKSGSTAYLYINGSVVDTDTSASVNIDFVGKPVRVGAVDSTPTFFWKGYVTDARIVKGTAITPPSGGPTERLEAVTNTSLLTCHLPYIADGSINDHSITVNDDVSTKPFSPYDYEEYSATDHGGSVFLGGTAHDSEDRLEITRDTSLTMGSGDFTYEAWVYLYSENVANEASLFSARASGYESFILKVRNSGTEGTNLLVSNSTGNSWSVLNAKGGAVFANVWTHVAIVRNGTSIKVYTNGKEAQSHTFSGSLNEDNNILYIGYDSDSRYGLGHVSDVRITKGTAVYTTEFTPPTAPLSSSGASLHIKGTDASIIDKSQGANLKLEGNTTGSTDLGANSDAYSGSGKYIKFDGSADYISLDPNNDLFDFSYGNGDFTVEGWFYFSSLPTSASNAPKLYIDIDSSTAYWQLYLLPSGLTLRANNTGIYITESTITWSTNTWYHISLSRSDSTYSVHVDGDRVINTTTTHQIGNHAYKTIGGTNLSSAQSLNGYIQDFRITRGLARYTAADETSNIPSAPLEG